MTPVVTELPSLLTLYPNAATPLFASLTLPGTKQTTPPTITAVCSGMPYPDWQAAPGEVSSTSPIDSLQTYYDPFTYRETFLPPSAVAGVFGMWFTADAGYLGGNYSTCVIALPPQTPLGLGNTVAVTDTFVSMKIRGADGVFGSVNVAAAYPATHSSILVGYGESGVRIDQPAPAGGGVASRLAILPAIPRRTARRIRPRRRTGTVPWRPDRRPVRA